MLVVLRPELPDRVMSPEHLVIHRHLPFIGEPNRCVRMHPDVNRCNNGGQPGGKHGPRQRPDQNAALVRAGTVQLACIEVSYLQAPSLAKRRTDLADPLARLIIHPDRLTRNCGVRVPPARVRPVWEAKLPKLLTALIAP